MAVFGLGGTGLAAVLGALAVGASEVIAVDARPQRLAQAMELGATGAVRFEGSAERVGAAVAEASGGGVDYAFETTARPAGRAGGVAHPRARRGGAARASPGPTPR